MLDKTQLMGVAEDLESDVDVTIEQIRKWIAKPLHGRTPEEVRSDVCRLSPKRCSSCDRLAEILTLPLAIMPRMIGLPSGKPNGEIMTDSLNPVVTAGDLIRNREYYARLWVRKYGHMRGFTERCVELLAPGLGECPKLPKSIGGVS